MPEPSTSPAPRHRSPDDAAPSEIRAPIEGGHREEVSFATDGAHTAATLWLPRDTSAPVAAVVTGPGFGGVKEMLIPEYGRALAARGIACLAFDPVGFGASGGNRRQHVDPHQQVRSFEAALSKLERDERIDADRLGVFGTSLSGAHALRCAANDPRVRCAVVIVPFIELPRAQSPRIAAHVAAEVARRIIRRPERQIPVAGPPGSLAAMTTDGAQAWLEAIATTAPTFRNAVTVMSLLNLTTYSARRAAGRLTIPTLAIVAERDSITPGRLVRRALRSAEHAEVVGFPETHFELFTEHLVLTVTATVEWFAEHLQPTQRVATRGTTG